MFRSAQLFRSSRTAVWQVKKQILTGSQVCQKDLEMPPCDFTPEPYKGRTPEEMMNLRKDKLSPTYFLYHPTSPPIIHEGKMQWLWDSDGKRYLDLFGGIATVGVGHCHPKVNEAVKAQMDKVWHTSQIYMHPNIHEYAERLTEKFPGDLKLTVHIVLRVNFLAALCGHSVADSASFKGKKGKLPFKDLVICKVVIKACLRVHKKASQANVEEQIAEVLKHAPHRTGGTKFKVCFFVNSGSEANDLAMFMARLYTGSFDMISLRNAYHGASPYIMGVTAVGTWKYNHPVGFGVHQTMNADVYRGIWGGANCRNSIAQTTRSCDCAEGQCKASDNYVDQLEDCLIHSCGSKVAGFIAEYIQGVGGTVQLPKGFLPKAYKLIRDRGGVCISDEVQTGFGRLGSTFWGFEDAGVMPDIVTMAKSIGNGFPLAAVVTTPEIAKVMGTATHFNTFGGNALGSAVGLAVLDAMEEDGTQKVCEVVGTHFLSEMLKLRDEFEVVGDVRGKGFMLCFELVTDKESKTPLPAPDVIEIWDDCKNMGILFGRGGLYGTALRMKPPMCLTIEDADFSIAVLRKALQNYTEKRK